MENGKKQEPPPPPTYNTIWGNSSVDFPSSQGSVTSTDDDSQESPQQLLSFEGVENFLSSMTPPMFQRKQGTIEESTQEFHDKNQRFLRQTRSPKARRDSYDYSKPSRSPAMRQSFKALPAIDDVEEANIEIEPIGHSTQSGRPPLVGESLPIGKDHDRYGSVADATNDGGENDARIREEALETRLKQMLERQSTKPSENQQFIKEYMFELQKERESLIAQWKLEFEESRQQEGNRMSSTHSGSLGEAKSRFLQPCIGSLVGMLSSAEVFFSNLPLTIGAVALAWVTMGVVWFKFMEENNSSCVPVHFFSPLCSFNEFPGCFECDTSSQVYQVALYFHNVCTTIAGILALTFLLKVIVAWRVVADELSNPTTATPCGVICITLVCVFAGRGWIGEAIVLLTSCFHLLFSFWFLYMAIIKFRILPDPSWFPGTVGLSYAAIKSWLYFDSAGKVLLAFCVIFFLTTFFISVIRVALSKKISAPVCWIQLSGPSITLYAFTIMAQPSRHMESVLEADAAVGQQYHSLLHEYYMPIQHALFGLSLIGCVSAVHSFWMRWDSFRTKEFSPAHVAFCFPSLSHTNAVQAYRGAVDAFSTIPPGSPFKIALYVYWVTWLFGGTALNLVFTYKFLNRLPKWTKIDMLGETEPPQPSETVMSEMLDDTGAHEILDQPFVSPAVLQANEAGALIRIRRGTVDYQRYGPYRRTRQVTALGFDPTMDEAELQRERAALLDWVAKNAPRTRKRTLSIPMMLKLKDKDGHGIYGSMDQGSDDRGHTRAQTMTDAPWALRF